MSSSFGVQPRWKRRADEIADAIGDELSVTVLAPVEVGNDIKIHTESITALAAALPSAADIASAIWSEVGRSVAINNAQSASDALHVELRNVQNGFTALASNVASAMKTGDAQPVKTSAGDTVDVSTATNQSITVNGSVSASIGNATVPIRTDANGDPVDLNGNVVELPVNGNNLPSINVANGNNVTVPVKATLAGIPQNTQGTAVYIPAKTVSNDPTKLANSSGNQVNVGVDVSTSSVPVKTTTGTSFAADVNGNLVEAPVSNQNLPNVLVKTLATNNTLAANAAGAAVNVPANFIGAGTLDVKVIGDETHGIIMSKTLANVTGSAGSGFTNNNINDPYTCEGYGFEGVSQGLPQLGTYLNGNHRLDGLLAQGIGAALLNTGWIIRSNGVDIYNQDISFGVHTIAFTNYPDTYGLIEADTQATIDKYHGRKVTLSSVANVWIVEPETMQTVEYFLRDPGNTTVNADYWRIADSRGTIITDSAILHRPYIDGSVIATAANSHLYSGLRVIPDAFIDNVWMIVEGDNDY